MLMYDSLFQQQQQQQKKEKMDKEPASVSNIFNATCLVFF